MKKPQESLKNWTKQKWRTKSGKPSGETGERYLPEKAIKSLSSSEYAATSKAKREGTKKGKQFVKQPKKIAKKTRKYRKVKCVKGAGKNPKTAKDKARKRSYYARHNAQGKPTSKLSAKYWSHKVKW